MRASTVGNEDRLLARASDGTLTGGGGGCSVLTTPSSQAVEACPVWNNDRTYRQLARRKRPKRYDLRARMEGNVVKGIAQMRLKLFGLFKGALSVLRGGEGRSNGAKLLHLSLTSITTCNLTPLFPLTFSHFLPTTYSAAMKLLRSANFSSAIIFSSRSKMEHGVRNLYENNAMMHAKRLWNASLLGCFLPVVLDHFVPTYTTYEKEIYR